MGPRSQLKPTISDLFLYHMKRREDRLLSVPQLGHLSIRAKREREEERTKEGEVALFLFLQPSEDPIFFGSQTRSIVKLV